jgi:pyruvate dehydrogenase E2 component (dihydrolipoamide acetyltransferase)
MPSLGADMEAGTLVEWMIKPGDRVKRGDIVAVVETQKGAIEVEIFETGRVEHVLVEVGAKVPVGTPLALIRAEGEAEPRFEATPPPIAVRTAVAAVVAAPSAAPPPQPDHIWSSQAPRRQRGGSPRP